MRKYLRKTKYVILALAILSLVQGLAMAPVLAGPEISGEFTNTLQAEASAPYHVRGQQELELSLEHFLGDAALYVGIQGSHYWPQQGTDNHWSLGVDEAYVDYYGKYLDLRVGKQRINWGTAMQVNPTSVLNPMNVNDPLGPKLPVYAVNLDYYLGHTWKLTGVYLPFFRPAVEQIPGNPLIEVTKPPTTFENGEFAIKLAAMGLAGTDFSLSYFRGKEDLPSLFMELNQLPKAQYRDVQIIGADLATTIGDVGLWAEGTYNLPASGDAYYQGVLGGDYGFANGLIIMGQYLHQSKDKQSTNLLLLGANHSLGLYEWHVGVAYDLKAHSLMFNPEVSYSLADSTQLIFGARYFSSEDPVGMLPKGQNHIYVHTKISF